MLLEVCSTCGCIHAQGFQCPERLARKKEWQSKRYDPQIRKFRNSVQWKRLRKDIVNRDIGCLVCMDRDTAPLDDLIEVHHIEPLAECWERRLDANNLITLCRLHHEMAEDGTLDKQYLYKLVGYEEVFEDEKRIRNSASQHDGDNGTDDICCLI